MSNFLHFSASTSVKNLFGRGLVTDQIAAVFELVKNSYDADAQTVNIIFSDLLTDHPKLIIEDDGTGMDLNDIETKWMIIGTDSKKKMMYSPIFNRPLNGDKGIGRFSVDRLGAKLNMLAIKSDSQEEVAISYDWNAFDGEEKNIEDIHIPYTIRKKTRSQGVTLEILELRDKWDLDKIKLLFRSLRQFKSPFSQEDNFKMFITAKEFDYDCREVTVEKLEGVSSLWIDAKISNDDLEHIQICVNKDGLEYTDKIKNPYSFGSVRAQVYFFNQGDKIRFSNRYGLRVREYGNVRLFRDNFRVYPYGEEKNDWLDIDRRMAQGYSRFFGSRDLIGYVQTSKEFNPNLKPLTNRQGLEENSEFEQLRNFIVQVCIKELEKFFFNKFKKNVNETIKHTNEKIISTVDDLKKISKEIKDDYPETANRILKYASDIKKQQAEQIEYVKEQKELVKVYSRIAQKETFLHKVIHQAMIRVKDSLESLDNLLAMLNLNSEQRIAFDSTKGCIVEAMNLLLKVRNDVVKKREKINIDIVSRVQHYINECSSTFQNNNIDCKLEYDAPVNYKMDPGDLDTIINNLVSNAVKSLIKVTDRSRKINIRIYERDRFVIIKFVDNGVGISETEREKIFDPFHSTTGGFGLGLTIIDEMIKEYAGTFELVSMNEPGAQFVVKLRR